VPQFAWERKDSIRTLGIHPKFFNLLLKQGGKDSPRPKIDT